MDEKIKALIAKMGKAEVPMEIQEDVIAIIGYATGLAEGHENTVKELTESLKQSITKYSILKLAYCNLTKIDASILEEAVLEDVTNSVQLPENTMLVTPDTSKVLH